MRILTALILASAAGNAAAFMGVGDMTEAEMMKLQSRLGEMTACMEKVDQDKLMQLQQRGEALASEVEKLCKDGKRDAAQQRAVEFAKTMNTSPVLAQIRECGKIVSKLPTMPPELNMYKDVNDNRHVCDF